MNSLVCVDVPSEELESKELGAVLRAGSPYLVNVLGLRADHLEVQQYLR